MTQNEYQNIIELIREKYISSNFGVDQISQNGEIFLKLSNGNISCLLKIVLLAVSEEIISVSSLEESNIQQLSKNLKCSNTSILYVKFGINEEIEWDFYYEL